MISAIVVARNEERNLDLALRSLRSWVDETIVIDQESTDRTAEIARSFGARVIPHPVTGYAEPCRAFARDQARGDWILFVDADEVVSRPLAEALIRCAAASDVDAVRIPRRNHLLGAAVLHSGWNPSRDLCLRFFRRDAVIFPTTIHSHPRLRPETRVVDLPPDGEALLLHFHVRDVSQFVERMDRYTTFEARERHERGERATPFASLRAAAREWLMRFVWHGGWKDGWRGFHLSMLMVSYRFVQQAKLAQLTEIGDAAEAERRDRAEAERWLAAYDAPGSSPAPGPGAR